MKIRHRIPIDHLRLTDEVTPEYQAEVDATVARAETRYAAAQRRVDAARKRLARAEQIKNAAHRVKELAIANELYAVRMSELEAVSCLMRPAGVGNEHRGSKRTRHRPVPTPKVF